MEDTFLYFGYGSGLNPTLVEFRINQPTEVFCKGKLENYSLNFSRKNPDGSARGNLQPQKTEYVLGLLYKIDINKFEQLAHTEPEYTLQEFDIITDKGTLKAFAFICEQCHNNIVPQEKYITGIINDAISHNFPEEYISKFKAYLPTK